MVQSQLMGRMGLLPGGRLVAVDLINTVSYPRRRTPAQAACNPMQGARTVPGFLGALDFILELLKSMGPYDR